jgi:dihydroorotate dehydrogenase (fumarate)
MRLRSPLVPSASPLSEDLGRIKRMEDAGAGAVVLYSLFEEQLTQVRLTRARDIRSGAPQPADPFPSQSLYPLTPEAYLNHLSRAREAVSIPVIASLNCTSIGGWAEYAKQIEQAGASALELNIYRVPTDLHETGSQIERSCIQIVEDVRSEVRIPLAVKLGPYYSNLANMAWRLERAGADALVLFNRFYQPDINLETMAVTPRILLSTPQAMRLPMRWIALLHGRVHTDFAATGGIHEAYDAAKLLLVGANVTMLCSVLLRRGVDYIRSLERDLTRWMDEHEFGSVESMIGRLSQQSCPDPEAFERAHYIRSLQSYTRAAPGAPTREGSVENVKRPG